MILDLKPILDEGLNFMILFSVSILLSGIFTMFVRKQNHPWIIPLVKALFLPGVIIHEFSHYIVCKIFSVRISKAVFFSSESISGFIRPINLDEKSPIQLFYIVFAPTFIGMGLIYYLFPYVISLNVPILPSLLLFYFLLSLLMTLHVSFDDLLAFVHSFKNNKNWITRDIAISLISFLMSMCIIYYINSFFGLFFANIIFQYLIYLILKYRRKIIPARQSKTNSNLVIPEEFSNEFGISHNRVSDLLDSNL